VQRLRQAVPHPGEVRHGWQVLAELSAALGRELELHSLPDVFAALAAEVPFYPEIHVDELGGQGVRWQASNAAERLVAGDGDSSSRGDSGNYQSDITRYRRPEGEAGRAEGGALRLGTYRDLWSGEVTERNPALRFLAPRQRLELAPSDAERLGVANEAPVTVRANGASVEATVAIRERLRPGTGFLIEGTRVGNANALRAGEAIEVVPAAEEDAE
jgi:predicted molibdopterin-dependent oxidoreductase YjgC